MMKDTYRILAKGVSANNNTHKTGINNNDLIIGPSGAGKTCGYVKPNIMQCNESMIIADTKGNLHREMDSLLKANGYRTMLIDFADLGNSYGYNPMDFIRWDEKQQRYCTQDIRTISDAIVPVTTQREPFWEQAAKLYLNAVIGYVMDCLPKNEHNLKYVVDLFCEIATGRFRTLMDEMKKTRPDSFAVQNYRLFEALFHADRTEASIIGILGEKLNGLNDTEAFALYTRNDRIDFAALGREKTAVFLTISDTDRSMDRMVNLFYTQAIQCLCRSADRDYADSRLKVPVRLILDDFATNAVIPDFQNITSVIRSREISVSIILQSITQLESIYGKENAATIVNNCDNCLYLGGQDVETAGYIGTKANLPRSTVLNMRLNDAYLFTRGQAPRKVQKFDLKSHKNYSALKEFEFFHEEILHGNDIKTKKGGVCYGL